MVLNLYGLNESAHNTNYKLLLKRASVAKLVTNSLPT